MNGILYNLFTSYFSYPQFAGEESIKACHISGLDSLACGAKRSCFSLPITADAKRMPASITSIFVR